MALLGDFVGDEDPDVKSGDDTDSFPAREDNVDVDTDEGNDTVSLSAPRADVGDDAEINGDDNADVVEEDETGVEEEDDEDVDVGGDAEAIFLPAFWDDYIVASLPAFCEDDDTGKFTYPMLPPPSSSSDDAGQAEVSPCVLLHSRRLWHFRDMEFRLHRGRRSGQRRHKCPGDIRGKYDGTKFSQTCMIRRMVSLRSNVEI